MFVQKKHVQTNNVCTDKCKYMYRQVEIRQFKQEYIDLIELNSFKVQKKLRVTDIQAS